MPDLERELDSKAAETGFSGVVRVDRVGEIEVAKAYGPAHRGWQIPNEVGTRFGIASGNKIRVSEPRFERGTRGAHGVDRADRSFRQPHQVLRAERRAIDGTQTFRTPR